MDYKNYSIINDQQKTKKVGKRVLSFVGILTVVVAGLVILGFIIYGLIVGVTNIFTQDTLRLLS
ncbi:hypothetical protein ACT1UH_02015 [Mycoplasma sp. 332]|uniref:hypothetical protein n=1 Tax=unclassified Asterococcus (in: mycoplasmas, genus) TaxID=3407551 RepID=UPI003F65DECB